MQIIPFETILTKVRDALKNSAAIKTFCQTKYSKDPLIFIGFNAADPPTDGDCPAIIVFPGVKSEGEEISEFSYNLTVSWSILNKSPTVTNNVVEYAGLYESDQLGHLIYDVLKNISANSPISSAEYFIDATTSHPQFPGRLDITFTIPVVIGGDISF